MNRSAPPKFNNQIYEEACSWFVDCRGDDLDETSRREFDRWLRKSPEHLSAYLEIAAIWDEGPAFDPTKKWNSDVLVAEAREEPGNVVSLVDVPSPVLYREKSTTTDAGGSKQPAGKRTTFRPRFLALAAAILLCTVILGAYLYTQRGVYATAIGEQRSIQFADGSTVELNSRSAIRVRYSEYGRDIQLLQGQALFHVAKDHVRPFVVSTDGTRVRALGTQFDVYRKTGGTTVTVLEGRVAVYPSSNAMSSREGSFNPPDLLLSAGEQLLVTAQVTKRSDHPNVAGATAWTQRQIVFESASLSEVAEEFNRYNQRPLIVENPQLYPFHISGVFSSTDSQSLLRFLRQRPGIRVTETATEIRITKNNS